MFDIGGTELLLIAVVALVVIGPKDLPRVLRVVGQYTRKARDMTRHLRSGFDEMLRQAEIEEMEKKWAEHNRHIMEQTPAVPATDVPAAAPAVAEGGPAATQAAASPDGPAPETTAPAGNGATPPPAPAAGDGPASA